LLERSEGRRGNNHLGNELGFSREKSLLTFVGASTREERNNLLGMAMAGGR